MVDDSTVKELVYSEELADRRGVKKLITSIISQYELFTESEGVVKENIKVIDDCTVTVYLKKYSQLHANSATKQCIMVRYPYMKIKHFTNGAILPYSALCIIQKDEISNQLRKIENPQHTDWEIKRLDNFADEKKKVKNTLRNLKKEIEIFIKGELTKGSGDSTDMVGAGEFLPSPDDIGDTFGEGVNTDFLRSTPLSATPVRVGKTSRVKEGADGSVFSNGEKSPSGEDGREPQPGERSGSQNPDGGSSPDSQFSQGGKKILKKTPLGGLSFRNFGVDEGKGKFILKFTSLVEEPDCEISLLMCGIERDTYPVDIIRAFEGGRPCRVKDGVITGLCLQKDRKYSIEYEIKPRESFSCEVRAYACR